MDFYTYLWLREDGTPFYVGKGTGARALDPQRRRFNPPDPPRILIQFHPTETEAFAAEIFLISFYGRLDLGTGCLRNLTDGGEGASGTVRRKGWHHTEEAKRRIVLSLLNNKRGVGHKNHIVPHSAAAKLKMSVSHSKLTLTSEHRRKIGIAGLGNTNYPKIRQNGVFAKEGAPRAEIVCR